MSKKQLISALATFAVLLIVAFFVFKKEDDSWQKGEFANKTSLIEDLQVNRVAKIAIFTKHERLELAINKDKWVVFNRDQYPADFEKIRTFIIKLRELKIAQNLRMKKTAFGSVKLLPPDSAKADQAGTQVNLYDAEGGTVLSLLLGDFHYAAQKGGAAFGPPRKDGRFVMVTGSDKPVLISDPLIDASPLPPLWLDQKFVKVTSLQSITRLDSKGKKLYSISRKSPKSPFFVEGLKKTQRPNPQKMQEATTCLQRLQFSDVKPLNTSPKVTGLNAANTLKIKSFHGILYTIQLGITLKKAFAKFAISLDMPKQRPIGKNEKPEEKSKLDKAYAVKFKNAGNRLRQEQFYTKWIYQIPLDEAKKLLIDQKNLTIEQAPPTIMGQ